MKIIAYSAVIFLLAGMTFGAENKEQAAILDAATAVVERDGKQGIPEALGLIEKAIAVNPSSDMPYVAAARVCLLDAELNKNGKSLDKALEYVNKAIKINPASAEARTCKAQILLDKKDDSAAVDELRQALKDEPGNLNANITHLGYLVRTGQQKKALAFAEESLGKVVNKTVVAKTYGNLMFNAGFWSETLSMYEKATAGGPTVDPDILKNSAFSFSKLGKFSGAANVYSLAYNAEPENKQLLVHISICYEKAGDLKKSAESLKQYVSFVPDDTSARRKLAGLYDRLDDKQAAGEIRKSLKAAQGGDQ